jgi:hypothetical protein
MKVKILRYVDLLVPNQIVDAADIRPDILETMLANKQAVTVDEPSPVDPVVDVVEVNETPAPKTRKAKK